MEWYVTDWKEVHGRLLAGIKDVNGCWEWQRAKRHPRRGYGCIVINQRNWLTHRAMWRCIHGEIQDKMCVLHKCDNEKCINPDHLFLGTHRDNMDDKKSKGRCKSHDQHGEFNHQSKLKLSEVIEIRKCKKEPNSYKELAHRFKVGYYTIYRICNGKSWNKKTNII